MYNACEWHILATHFSYLYEMSARSRVRVLLLLGRCVSTAATKQPSSSSSCRPTRAHPKHIIINLCEYVWGGKLCALITIHTHTVKLGWRRSDTMRMARRRVRVITFEWAPRQRQSAQNLRAVKKVRADDNFVLRETYNPSPWSYRVPCTATIFVQRHQRHQRTGTTTTKNIVNTRSSRSISLALSCNITDGAASSCVRCRPFNCKCARRPGDELSHAQRVLSLPHTSSLTYITRANVFFLFSFGAFGFLFVLF